MPITRSRQAQTFLLEAGVDVTVLTGKETGASALNAGLATFGPGVALACHTHDCEESITILAGAAFLDIAGERTRMEPHDTSVVPGGVPHRFSNASAFGPMTMFWVYASASAGRTLVDAGLCEGAAPDRPSLSSEPSR